MRSSGLGILIAAALGGCSFQGNGAVSSETDAGNTESDAGEQQADAAVDGGIALICGSEDPASDNLVACFEFEDTIDETIGDIPTAQGVGSMTYVAGVDGQALRLDGSSYVFSTGDAALLQQTITVDMWVRPAEIPMASRVGLLDLEGVLGVFIAPGGGVRCNGRYGDITVGNLTVGQWTHVACRHSATNGVEVFIDGEQQACDHSRDDNVGGLQPVMLGANSPSGDQGFTGALDTVRFSTRSLGDAEMCTAAGESGCAPPAQLCP